MVTVAIISHGRSGNLERAIASILAQTYEQIELMILHEGSFKPTVDTSKLPNGRIRVVNESFEDTGSALDFAVQNARGAYFAWLSQDDVYAPDKLATEVSKLGNGDAVAVSDWLLVNPNNRTVESYAVSTDIEKGAEAYMAFSQDAQLNTCAMLFPVEVLRECSGFAGIHPPSRDLALLSSLARSGVRFVRTGIVALRYSTLSEERYLGASKIENSVDHVNSNIIRDLSYDAILAYFGDVSGAVNAYEVLLSSSRPRSAAYLMAGIISGAILNKQYDVAEKVITNDLSGMESGNDMGKIISTAERRGGKKRILFTSAHWLTGGMERVLSILFRELKDDYEIFLLTPHDDRQSRIEVAGHVTWIKISDENFQKNFDVIILAYALVLRIDVVIGFINLFKKQLNFYKLSVDSGIKTVASNHEYYFYPYKSPVHYDMVQSRLEAFEVCDAVVWPNGFNAALCGSYIQNSYVIGNPNNFEISKQKQKSKENIVICIGRFNDYVKRVDRILECFSIVLRKVPDAKLVLVGKYEYEAPIHPGGGITLSAKINELAIPSENIEFVGEVNNVQDYLKKAKVLMLTSNSEGFGMVLNEAACFGVPSVCNSIPGLEDIIEDGKNGYITEQGDLDAMAAKVSEILTDNVLCGFLSKNAKEMATKFDSRHIGDRWRLLLETLTAQSTDTIAHDTLVETIGYKVHDYQQLSSVLSREINEVFLGLVGSTQTQMPLTGLPLFVSKAVGLPKRLKKNIEYEGVGKTIGKVTSRSAKIVRKFTKAKNGD